MLGEEYEAFAEALDDQTPVSIRRNPLKFPLVNQKNKVPWTTYGAFLSSRPVFTMDPLFHGGAYYVQEASSMFLEQAFLQHAPKGAITALDLCAAPGGKSTHLLSLMNADSLLVSNEVIRSRVGPLTENIQKWGHPNCVVTSNDAADFQSVPGFFDVIVVDAPCSGEGMFRKDPDARTEWSPENVDICSARQKRILDSVWPALKQDGLLFYSTCTFNQAENEENLRWLSKQCDVEFLQIKIDPAWGVDEVREGAICGYRFYPHKAGGEGFFLAVIRKLEAQEEVRFRSSPKDRFTPASKKVSDEIVSWLRPGQHSFIQRDEIIQLLPGQWQQTIHALTKHLRVVYAGTYLATQKHDKLIPDHSLALSVTLNPSHFFQLELSEAQAITFLRKETLILSLEHRGFALVTFNNLPLGWVNVLPGRINNLYPPAWRIRMSP